ncbi:Peptidoglycan-associated lipoprotein [subsurface metagenome]
MLLEKKEVINANISYKIGICYLNIRGKKNRSIPYLESASQNVRYDYQNTVEETNAPLKAILLLGVAYRINNELKKAIKTFESLRDKVAISDSELDAIIDMHIKRCENAILLGAFPGEPRTEKLPDHINNEFSNFNPVLVDHDRVLYYMEELKFYDALMRVESDNDSWGMPENLTPKIGSDGDHILVGASSDGKTLLLYIYEALKAGEIYSIQFADGGWSKLKPLNKNINTKYHETHASYSAKNETLYFTSNRPEGYGGLDIYMSKLDENNNWGPAVNLGPIINTPYNEETPIINNDDNILYFSSQGHLNMGGYDVFHSLRKEKNEWRQPINMGSPVSTTDDDLFYFPLESGISGLMSRLEESNSTAYDIYRYNSMVFANSPRFDVRGKVQSVDSSNYIDHQVIVVNNETSDTLISRIPEPDGNYEILLPAGNFSILVFDQKGNISSGTVILEDGDTEKEVITGTLAQRVDSIESEEIRRDTVYLKHLLFGFDNHVFSTVYKNYLDTIISIMHKYPSLVINIEGYTDAIGSENYNLYLSRRRANAVARYLLSDNIGQERIKVIAHGESNPIAINTNTDGTDCPDGRRYNRRVELVPQQDTSEVIFVIEIHMPERLKQK